MGNKTFYIDVSTDDLSATNGDLALAVWYSALKGYRRVFRPDVKGFTRVANSIVERDLKMNRVRAWRYNQKLAMLGLIELEKDKQYGFAYKIKR